MMNGKWGANACKPLTGERWWRRSHESYYARAMRGICLPFGFMFGHTFPGQFPGCGLKNFSTYLQVLGCFRGGFFSSSLCQALDWQMFYALSRSRNGLKLYNELYAQPAERFVSCQESTTVRDWGPPAEWNGTGLFVLLEEQIFVCTMKSFIF